MAKPSGRFRNRKLGFKSRIQIRIGQNEFVEDLFDPELDFEGEEKPNKQLETGVDKDEEGEIHLQQVIASTNASVSRQPASPTESDETETSAPKIQPKKAFIPTPDSTGVIDNETFSQLYPSGYTDPMTYIRFSDTVEDATKGAVNYTMDEHDEEFLESIQPKTGENLISDDDFEHVMELLEQYCEQKSPMAHIELNSLPTLSDVEAHFKTLPEPENSFLDLARQIFPHWKLRRIERNGRGILAQLDYDETNESNPYVCFRRRELKSSRKTRRSDQQNLERLIRLRNDLFAAKALMEKARERENLKLDTLRNDRLLFEQRVLSRDLKRRLGESEGDEDLLVAKREKKRKKEETAPMTNTLKLSLGAGRKPDPQQYTAATLSLTADQLKLRKDRAAQILIRIEKDFQRKRETDANWEDFTDSAFSPRPQQTAAKYWRTVEPNWSAAGTLPLYGFSHPSNLTPSKTRASFRRRVGRGGRILLDRIRPSAREISEPLGEKFRYDSDFNSDFGDSEILIDDFNLKFLIKRANLISTADLESISCDSNHLEQSFSYASQQAETQTQPPAVFGRPPPRQPIPAQPGGPGGVPISASSNGYAAAQAQVAQNNAMRMAQQQQQARLLATLPNGANGLPSTSRLAQPPYSNLQMALHQQQQQQQAQQQQIPPNRPDSAKSATKNSPINFQLQPAMKNLPPNLGQQQISFGGFVQG